MAGPLESFASSARSLARNPLGIIALFIVLVYGFASLVTAFAGAFTPSERIPLVYFLILFPVLVLAVFFRLVSKHSANLYAPSDYRDEKTFYELQMATASLSAAAASKGEAASLVELTRIVEMVRAAGRSIAERPARSNHVLWVDDHPDNNTYERQAFEAMGLRFTLARSTSEALDLLDEDRYAAIISDMGRAEGPREGYVLLDRLRKDGDHTPFFFYASSNSPEHRRMTREHGGQGCTNNAQELFEMVTGAVLRRDLG